MFSKPMRYGLFKKTSAAKQVEAQYNNPNMPVGMDIDKALLFKRNQPLTD